MRPNPIATANAFFACSYSGKRTRKSRTMLHRAPKNLFLYLRLCPTQMGSATRIFSLTIFSSTPHALVPSETLSILFLLWPDFLLLLFHLTYWSLFFLSTNIQTTSIWSLTFFRSSLLPPNFLLHIRFKSYPTQSNHAFTFRKA